MIAQDNPTNDNPRDIAKLNLARRFVKYDVKSGIEGTTEEEYLYSTPKAVRYLSKATLYVDGLNSDSQRIYRPYVVLTYTEKTLTNIGNPSGTTFVLEVTTDLNRPNTTLKVDIS